MIIYYIPTLLLALSLFHYSSGHSIADTSDILRDVWGLGKSRDKRATDDYSYHSYDMTNSIYGDNRYHAQDNHKPLFVNCTRYQPTVKEEQEIGVKVFQVRAVDQDPPDSGGNITYTFVAARGERLKFAIQSHTGIITTNSILDRDEPSREKEVYLTVRATDNGRPQLDDVCTIKVVIEDINDNPPVFDKVNYQESVPQDLPVGSEVMRISATDIDDGNNSIVVYDLVPRSINDSIYFKIDKNSGVITLDRAIDKKPDYRFRLRASATDQGDPPNAPAIMDLDILVVESNKKAPVFTSIFPTSPIYLLENLTDFMFNIATLTAISNTDEKAPLFLLVAGRTEQTNKLTTFRLESEGRTAQIRLARQMDYESIAEYTLTVRIQNKFNLAAETLINIHLEDVNDNIPVFTEVVSGAVPENEPPGTPVMQVKAIDHDATTSHNQVLYELADNTDNFAIDAITGNITTLKTFDREKQDFYNVKVIATDNSPSALYSTGEHNKGEQVFRIEISDKNDHPPSFTQDVYIAEAIPEDSNINALVTEVKALDNDTASPVIYSIIEGNIGQVFFIEEKTGKIRVKAQLDYETRTNYTLRVRAYDGAFEDYCIVEIKIENVNDNPPIFKPYKNDITIKEEELITSCIAELEAYDPDIPDRSAPQHIVYFVVKEEQQKLLSIDKRGCLTLIKPLDRDPPNGFEIWQVLIAANDEDGSLTSLRESTEVVITLLDENDNAPFLDIPQPVVWGENQSPDTITTLVAKDNDGPENGPPFLFALSNSAPAEIKEKFSISGNNLRALVRFDREEKKVYMVPISITDSGSPPQTGQSTLMVVIGDLNDNAMKSGHSSIFVYNYKGEAPDTEIGRVYVDDPDDWDLPDKVFTWAQGVHPNFDVNTRNGMITLLKDTPDGSYLLNFTVTEEGIYIPRHTVSATVNVTVKEIPEEAVDKSGSIRFSGITAEEFVEVDARGRSKQSMLQRKLAEYFNISEENVDVFTVLHSPHHDDRTLLDVRFSAHGSPYYQAEQLNAAASLNKADIEKELGVIIQMVSIDECLIEKQYCETSCSNFLNKSNVPSSVYTNTTSFVGVGAVVDPLCICDLTHRVTCFNGGTPSGAGCECPTGYDGPYCEILSVGFLGDGWALYPTFKACADSHVTMELIAHKANGLVFYTGPTTTNQEFPVQDFMSLELRDGFPVLLVDFGSGTVRIDQKEIKISDGNPHRIDITWSKTSIELEVDKCKLPSCLSSLSVPIGPNELLNVHGPLQIGGTFVDVKYVSRFMNWSHIPVSEGFTGCIRNLTFNGKLYNLGMPGYSRNVDIGCATGLAVAISLGIDTSFIIAILVCTAILIILLLAVVVHRRKHDNIYKDPDDITENIINYEDEGGGEGDITAYDLNVLRPIYFDPENEKRRARDDAAPDMCTFLDGKKANVDADPESGPYDDVRHYAYEGDGNTTGSLSSLASGTDDGDLDFDYLSNFGPRFRKLADMYGEDPSDDDDDNYHHMASESWC